MNTNFEFRPSLGLLQQIATIERATGHWERLSMSPAFASDELFNSALISGSKAILALDGAASLGLGNQIQIENLSATDGSAQGSDSHEFGQVDPGLLEAPLVAAHKLEAPFSIQGIEYLWELISGGQNNSSVMEFDEWAKSAITGTRYRHQNCSFLVPMIGQSTNEVVFSTVPPFLISQRLEALVNWTNNELRAGLIHPIVVIGTFHLLFLQIHPFSTANHRLSLILAWRLLDDIGYSFVRNSHFAPWLSSRSKNYFSALRQAEKTAQTNWSTLNIWLELFADSLREASESVLSDGEKQTEARRLTFVQKRIIEVVKNHGSVSRDKIVNETGINLSTIKYNLSVLADKGHLKRDGGGRGTSYTIL